MRPSRGTKGASGGVDVIGLLTSAAAAFCLLYAFTEGQTTGFADPLIIGLLVAAVVLGVAFVLVERRVHEPLVDLRLFRARDFDGALTANLVMNIVFAGLSFLLALYLETVRGYSALEAGLLLFPSTLTILVFNPIGSRMAARRGSRTPVAGGLVLLGLGTVLAGLVSTDSPYWLLLAGLLVLGAGLGLLSVPISNTAVAGPPPELAGTASGLFKMSSMLGGAIGVALCAAVAKGIGISRARDDAVAAGLTEEEFAELSNSLSGSDAAAQVLVRLPPDQQQAVMTAYHDAYAAGVAGSVQIAGVFALAAVVLVLWLWPRHR